MPAPAIKGEFVLGFEARHQPMKMSDGNHSEYQTHFLLNPNLATLPYSVDPMVWHRAGKNGTEAYETVSGMGLLESVNPAHHVPYPVIAITLAYQPEIVSPMSEVNPIEYYPLAEKRMRPAAEWTFYGYDVADEWMTSGLCNCGYTPEELDPLTVEWATRINEYGLITTIDDAQKFQILTNHRVPEHAPFFIYGVYEVTEAVSESH